MSVFIAPAGRELVGLETQKPPRGAGAWTVMGAVGFEPTKAEPSDLQSDPFVHFGTRPLVRPRPVNSTGCSRHGEKGQYRRDRKSTRLNSSHTVISYAVFCLKK